LADLSLLVHQPSDIEVVFGRKNVNKQLRIKAPKILPPVMNGVWLDKWVF